MRRTAFSSGPTAPQPRRRPILGNLPVPVWAAVIAIGMAITAEGSVTVGLKAAGQTDEQHYQQATMDAERSQEEKIRVGEVRYEKKLAARRSFIRGMQTELARRQTLVSPNIGPGFVAVESAREPVGGNASWWCGVALGIAGLALLTFRLTRKTAGKVARW